MRIRVFVLALVVAGLGWSGPAYGQLGTLWLQGTDGSGTIEVGVSETAIIQLWLEIEPDVILMGMEAVLRGATRRRHGARTWPSRSKASSTTSTPA